MNNPHDSDRIATAASAADQLCERISRKEARVGIVGFGYVGLPLALGFSEKGFSTTGFEVDAAKVASLHNGVSYIGYFAGDAIAKQIEQDSCESGYKG